jgi:hypothetical protein
MSKEVQVWGASRMGCLRGLAAAGAPSEDADALMAHAGLDHQDPQAWCPQQPYLDLLREVERRFGEKVLRAMARQVPDTSHFPPGNRSLGDALQTLDIAYQLNHRRGPIGHYACLPLGPREVLLECANPYGCAFDLGILDALTAHFGGAGEIPAIRHQPGTGSRREGQEACTYHITW